MNNLGRRVYVKGKKTYAKGQAPDLSKSNRYQNIISLMSIRVENVHERNPLDRTGEFYFEVGGKGLLSHDYRIPFHGEISIKENLTYSLLLRLVLLQGVDFAVVSVFVLLLNRFYDGGDGNTLKLFEGLELSYEPPPTSKTYICELYLGQEVVDNYLGSSMHVFLLNIPRLEFAALVPKGDYVTLCLLGREIDGALVGGASLDPASFFAIIRFDQPREESTP